MMRRAYTAFDFRSACMRVQCADRRGTGFLVTADTVLTCAHVVGQIGTEARVIVASQDELSAYVQKVDKENDIALLKLEQGMTTLSPLPLASDLMPIKGMPFETYGFPLVTGHAGLLLRGEVHEPIGQDLNGRPVLVLYSPNVTANALLHGFSGAPVWAAGQVIGQLKQIIPDSDSNAQFGVIFACPVSKMELVSSLSVSGSRRPMSLPRAPGGSFDPKAYVSRPYIERQAHSYLNTAGMPTILWGPERFGKTWLIERLLDGWQENYKEGLFVRLNLHEFSKDDFGSYSIFLFQFGCQFVEQILGSKQLLSNEWSKEQTPNFRIKEVVRKLLIQCERNLSKPMLLIIDHADELLRYPSIMGDFFRMLRSWADEKMAPWPALRILLAVSISPSRLTDGIHSSPFENLSDPILIEPLEVDQIGILAGKYGLNWKQGDIMRLRDWVGGHPYLISVLLYEAVLEDKSLDDLFENPPAAIERHLKRRRELLAKNPNLGDTLRKVIASGSCPIADATCRDALFQAGLIERVRSDRGRRDHYRVRGEIYKEILP